MTSGIADNMHPTVAVRLGRGDPSVDSPCTVGKVELFVGMANFRYGDI